MNNPTPRKELSDYRIGDKVNIKPSRHGWDTDQGPAYVVGLLAPADLKLARHPGDSWQVIVHLSRIEGSGW